MSCPICNKNTDPTHRPFCSKRCADLDLARWLGGHYAIPSNNPDDLEAAVDAAMSAEEVARKNHIEKLAKPSGQRPDPRLEGHHPNANAFPMPG